ncbi:hypothetical protein TNIN_103951 [Trichonephila inaurata madagascariensis]|uniref:Uncharacterized protein n=1 Tax=Trichonephila inaurata madagascariensis TaxID=2747483 RepID=A0A8X6JAR6_9ARAC|nr:hypothetical protein TNIN_103951 [Trichonephila inaurata madagascariensis]
MRIDLRDAHQVARRQNPRNPQISSPLSWISWSLLIRKVEAFNAAHHAFSEIDSETVDSSENQCLIKLPGYRSFVGQGVCVLKMNLRLEGIL